MVDNLYGRSYDVYSAALERREVLNDMSTRELLEELEDRLERRQKRKPATTYTCSGCGASYATAAARDACLNSVRISCYAFLGPEAH
jgi:hypothetical protein